MTKTIVTRCGKWARRQPPFTQGGLQGTMRLTQPEVSALVSGEELVFAETDPQ